MGAKHKYDSEAKQAARGSVHTILASVASPYAKILLLAGPKRKEVDVAVANGWSMGNVVIVEEIPATMANFTRQFTAPEKLVLKPNQYRGTASSVCKLLPKGSLKAIHLDFCDPIEGFHAGDPRSEIEKIVRSGVLDETEALFAITVLNGRVRGYSSLDDRRRMLLHAVRRKATVPVTQIATGTYYNSTKTSCSPMLWSIFRFKKEQ